MLDLHLAMQDSRVPQNIYRGSVSKHILERFLKMCSMNFPKINFGKNFFPIGDKPNLLRFFRSTVKRSKNLLTRHCH